MGTYLNPGNKSFMFAVNSKIYVDKTEMIQYLNTLVNTQKRYVSVSRPRRFGKTIAADMVCAYYDRTADSRSLFEKLLVAGCKSADSGEEAIRWDEYLGKFDVIRIVMTKFLRNRTTVSQALENMQRLVINDYKKAYPDVELLDETDLIQTLDDVYGAEDRQVVVVIDEWDAIFRERKDDQEGQSEYLDFLRDLMKDNSHVALAYMTGILPIKKYGRHSALNMFTEYSMLFPRELAKYTGFTEQEVKELSKKYGRNYDQLKEWYDGYLVSCIIPPDPEHKEQMRSGEKPVPERYSLYCPLSVDEAVTTGIISNYWNKTETFEALSEYISINQDRLKDAVTLLMDGSRVKVDTTTYQNDMTTFTCRDDVLTLLIHLGYLGFDDENSEVFIPNREILEEFRSSTKDSSWIGAFESLKRSQELLEATWNKDEEKVAEMLEAAHNRVENRTYNDEAALAYAIQYAYYTAEKYYTILPELDTGKGYADRVYIPRPGYSNLPVLLIELKNNKDAEGAIAQIRRQDYPARLEHYKGNILMIGINYDKDVTNTSTDFKRHSCVIEKA